MDTYQSLPAMFFESARRGGSQPRCMSKRGAAYRTTSWAEFRAAVEEIASGLIGLGVAPGDKVAILAATRQEWAEVDFGALAIGAVTIPIYPSSLARECGYILSDSGACTVFAENAVQAAKIKKVVAEGASLAEDRRDLHVDNVIVFDGYCEGALTLAELREQGNKALAARRPEIELRTAALGREDLATIVYTSGTTGLPKGVVQSHGNHLAALEAVGELDVAHTGEIDFSFLPLAHSFGRMLGYFGFYAGTVTAYAEKIDTLMDDIAATKPHMIPSVPRIFEKVYAAVQQAREASGPVAQAIFDAALAVGEQRAEYVNRGEAVPMWLSVLDATAHTMVFNKIHERLGGRVRHMMSGGAPLSAEINRFFHAVGLPVLEGYGLTETTPILTCNRPGEVRIGTVGKAVRGVTLELAADGEILGKGPNVASGYYRRPEETAAAWDEDGWFHTGDIGTLEDGYLSITDRKKELIKTAGGKYVAPQKIENMLKARRYVSQAVVIGDRLKYCIALITVDPDAAKVFAASHAMEGASVAAIVASKEMERAVAGEVEAVNTELASFETIKYFRIAPRDFSVETGELTPSLKIKRKAVGEKYQELISSMIK